jgi:hypothetical protein
MSTRTTSKSAQITGSQKVVEPDVGASTKPAESVAKRRVKAGATGRSKARESVDKWKGKAKSSGERLDVNEDRIEQEVSSLPARK